MSLHFLAFDLGAQSGRAILGRLSSGVLDVSEIGRFANEPLHQSGSLRWNADGLFSRNRVIDSLRKYGIEIDETESTGALRTKLAEFYAARTITKRAILPRDCANAICWLAGSGSATTTGHIIPIDGGLPDAFVR